MKRMQIRPQPWTHHHVHRLFHLSMGLCFGIAALVMATGMAFSFKAGAFDVTDQHDLSISAEVGGISPGPTNPPTTGSTTTPTPTANPTITIVAEPQGQIPGRNIGTQSNPVNAYVFPTTRPSFSGTTSVPNGLVFIYIDGPAHLNSTTRADDHGYWFWQSPDVLPAGIYTIRASVFDSYDLTRSGHVTVYFVIEIPKVPVVPADTNQPGQPSQPSEPSVPVAPVNPPTIPTLPDNEIFGVFFETLPQYKSTEGENKVIGWVSLVSNAGLQIVSQDVHYQIISPKGKVVLETTDTVSFSKQLQYLKTFQVAPLTPAGQYTVRISSTYNGIESVASDTFTLREPAAVASVAPQGPAVIWSLLILLFLLFIILMIIAYRYVRHHTRELNRPAQEPAI